MADDKETARKLGEPIVVFLHADVCKTGPLKVPVPYPIIAPLSSSIDIAATVRATQVPTFAMKSSVPLVIGDEAGSGGGVASGTFAGTGSTFPTGSSRNVRAEKSLLIRNGDPFAMNGGNTSGMLVYQPGGAPKGQVDAAGKPSKNPNPPVNPTKKEQGWLDWATDKAAEGWNATSDAAEKAYDIGKKLNEDYAIVPRALGTLQAAGGLGEMGLGAVGLAAPTGVTQVLGGAAVLHGADNTSTGLRQAWTGKYQNTLTQQGAAKAASLAGASPEAAELFGDTVDLGSNLLAPAAAIKSAAAKELAAAAKAEAQALAKKEALELEKAAAKKSAMQEVNGVRVLKKPARPPTDHVKYPNDMKPYQNADGTWKYPDNQGFLGASKDEVLPKGTVLDRFGGEKGDFLSPAGTPYEGRALPPTSKNAPYNAYEVMRPLPVQSGPIAPAFGQPGGGTQFLAPRSVGDLVDSGYLRRLP